MKIICPNLKNKEVAREFEELKNATSEAAAYHIWSQNNGNGIDKAPNGEPSKLFSDLLEHYNGDRVAAIQAKARTYSKSFKEWFGESKVVDKNGEPLVVYHGTGTPNKIEEFKSKNNKIWFTDKSTAQAYANFDQDMRDEVGLDSSNNIYPVFLSIKNPKYFDNVSYTTLENFESTNNDGMIATNVSDYEGSQEQIVAFSPNQIKSIDNQGTFSTQDNNIYLADSNSENISQLKSMQPYSNSKELLDNMDSEMATVLNDVTAKINMQPVSIEYTDRPLNEIYPEATYWTPAIYDRNSNTIVVNRNGDFSRYGSLENVLLHEIAHAITLDSLASNTEAANELRKIQKEYAEKYEDHASKNVYEFAAELFSNPEVIHHMFDFPATKGEKTLIQKIIDWFKRLFGKNTTHQDLINKIVDNVIEFNAYQTLEQREDSYDYIPDVLPAASKREEIASIKLRSVFSDMVKTAENRVASLRYNVIEDKFDRNENLRNDKLLSNLRSIQNSITDVEGVNNITNFLNGSLEYVDNVIYSLDEAEG